MKENVVTSIVGFDETEAFFIIEHLDYAFRHALLVLISMAVLVEVVASSISSRMHSAKQARRG
jgi:hypothetical protein